MGQSQRKDFHVFTKSNLKVVLLRLKPFLQKEKKKQQKETMTISHRLSRLILSGNQTLKM